MADENPNENTKGPVSGEQLLTQALNDLDKAERESVKARLKNMLAEKKAAQQALRLIEAKIEKYITEFNAGTLVIPKKDKNQGDQNK